MRNISLFLFILFAGVSLEVSLCGAQDSAGDLAKAAQNPVAYAKDRTLRWIPYSASLVRQLPANPFK